MKKRSTNSAKKPFKLNVLGIVQIQAEGTLREIILILVLTMFFFIALIILIKTFVIPMLSVTGIIMKFIKLPGFVRPDS